MSPEIVEVATEKPEEAVVSGPLDEIPALEDNDDMIEVKINKTNNSSIFSNTTDNIQSSGKLTASKLLITEIDNSEPAETKTQESTSKRMLIEEIVQPELDVDVSNKRLIEAVVAAEDKKEEKAKDMFESFKNLNSEFEALD